MRPMSSQHPHLPATATSRCAGSIRARGSAGLIAGWRKGSRGAGGVRIRSCSPTASPAAVRRHTYLFDRWYVGTDDRVSDFAARDCKAFVVAATVLPRIGTIPGSSGRSLLVGAAPTPVPASLLFSRGLMVQFPCSTLVPLGRLSSPFNQSLAGESGI